jgi:hypothetical protein
MSFNVIVINMKINTDVYITISVTMEHDINMSTEEIAWLCSNAVVVEEIEVGYNGNNIYSIEENKEIRGVNVKL